jgi:hypothetical protein
MLCYSVWPDLLCGMQITCLGVPAEFGDFMSIDISRDDQFRKSGQLPTMIFEGESRLRRVDRAAFVGAAFLLVLPLGAAEVSEEADV